MAARTVVTCDDCGAIQPTNGERDDRGRLLAALWHSAFLVNPPAPRSDRCPGCAKAKAQARP